jgi:hypothetical protein
MSHTTAKAPVRPRARRLGAATVLGALLSALLAGCGGGEDVDYFGAIALNPQTRAASIVANHQSQGEANSAALNLCTGSCSVVLTFGNGMCGALARSTLGTVGYASNSSKSQAEANAMSQCRSLGGSGCEVLLSMCNG